MPTIIPENVQINVPKYQEKLNQLLSVTLDAATVFSYIQAHEIPELADIMSTFNIGKPDAVKIGYLARDWHIGMCRKKLNYPEYNML
jgi:hypothetical protein